MNEPTVVGVIADTHNRLPVQAVSVLTGCDLILHAGDVCEAGVLEELREVAPVVAVRGNNDLGLDSLPWEWRGVLRGVRFAMTHIPPGRAPSGCDWLIVGHTHRPQDEVREGVRWFNPGSAGLANKGKPRSVARLVWRGSGWEPELHVLNS